VAADRAHGLAEIPSLFSVVDGSCVSLKFYADKRGAIGWSLPGSQGKQRGDGLRIGKSPNRALGAQVEERRDAPSRLVPILSI
jgi:hypothetical protein